MNTNQVVYGCQYYLYSSLPSQYESDCVGDEFYGLSPESLAYGDMSEDVSTFSSYNLAELILGRV